MRLKHHHLATAISTTRTCATPVYRRDGRNNASLKLVTTGNVTDNWKVWKQMWCSYIVIAQLEMEPPAYKVAMFLHCIGVDALKIFNGFQFDGPGDENDLANIIQEFDEFAIGELNKTFERYAFNSRTQQENKSIDANVTALRTLAKTCNFCDCMSDSIICDRILLGTQDHRTRKRLLQERSLTLSKYIDLCNGSEATNLRLKTISGAQNNVHAVKDHPLRRHDDKSKKSCVAKPRTRHAKHILSKKTSVQRGVQNVQDAGADIISKQPAQLRLENCTA